MESFDCVVIGAGVIGLSAALDMVQEQKKTTLLLDQFPFPNNRNSSSGHTRIFRNAYTEPIYTTLIQKALPQWRQIEKETNKSILNPCGVLYGGDEAITNKVEDYLRSKNLPYERLNFMEVKQRWPQFENFSPKEEFILDPSGGFMCASTAMLALQEVVVKKGCVFRDNEKVLSIHPSDHEVRVQTNKNEYKCKSVIVTAGPWNIGLMANLGVRLNAMPLKVSYWYFKVRAGEDSFDPSRCPVMVHHGDEYGVLVMFPVFEFPGLVKTGYHRGVPADPDTRDKVPYPKRFTKILTNFVRTHAPQLESQPAVIENCMYTDTPDYHYIIDRHPKYPRVIVGGGFSGHGFKLAPAVGRILSHMAVNKSPEISLDTFKIDRPMTNAKL